MSSPPSIRPDDIVITHRLYRRKARAADLVAELRAFHELSALLSVDPNLAIQRFLDLAVELCPGAGSAGLSELVVELGGELFRWTAMSGAFAEYVGGTTPRDFSPCGLCLDRNQTILVDRPARLFTYFNDAKPDIFEGLIVPLLDTGKRPIGTLWVASHTDSVRFDPTDARVLEQLAVQLVLAIKLRRKAALYERLEDTVRDRDILVEEVQHRVKNMLQMTSGLLQVQERASRSDEVRSALQEAQSRLLTLSGVYENLLEGRPGERDVDAAKLIGRLVEALKRNSSSGHKVELALHCESVMLPSAAATSVGMIVNEAVTNSLKYAFADQASGRIVVQLERSGRRCSLAISDDGSGFAGGTRGGGLGMRLMKSMAQQLNASLSIDGAQGTTLRVEWKEPAAREAPRSDLDKAGAPDNFIAGSHARSSSVAVAP
jgi:two-component sensor histidine kinase